MKQQDYLEKANLLEAELSKEQQSIEAFRKKITNYSQLKGLVEKLSMRFTLQDTSRLLTLEMNKVYGEDITVILYLSHPKTGDLGISSSRRAQAEINLKAKKGDMYDKWVLETTKPLLVEDTKNDFRFDIEKIVTGDTRVIRSLMSVPMAVGGKVVGILRLDSPQENYFATEDMRLLSTVSDLGAVAIENAYFYERIEDLAIRDSLTGLFLRRHLLDRLSQEMSRELRRQKELSFLMIDLDDFKKYNDTFGHTAGDIVLKTVGVILMDVFNDPGNIVCRHGGEEFSVLLPDCSKQRAVKLAETVRERIEAETIVLRRKKTHMTVSIGVATFPKDAQMKEELIQQADLSLYKAKEEGKNRVCAV